MSAVKGQGSIPTSTITAGTASAIAIGSVSPSRKFQARPSQISWASRTGPLAQVNSRFRPQAQSTIAAPYATKKTDVVTPMVSRSELMWRTSPIPYITVSRPSTKVSAAATTSGGGAPWRENGDPESTTEP